MGIFSAINYQLGRDNWPPPALERIWAEIELFQAFRASNEVRLRQTAGVRWNQPYMISPVPRMISRASANLLFGATPRFSEEADTDQANTDRIVEDNGLDAELHRAAMISSSEGETWGRLVVDPSLLDVPIIEFVSRDRVIPHFAGRFLLGATFITEWATSSTERFRLFETYEPGIVTNTLYRGSVRNLGAEVNLDSFPETKGTPTEVLTGIDKPLVAYIPNSIDSDPSRGYSDYQGLQDRFLGLNEAATVTQRNVRLTGLKRAIVDMGYMNNDQRSLPSGDDIFLRQSRSGGDDKTTAPLQVIDYDFKADQLILWLDSLIDTSLSFAGIAPQLVGRGDLGRTPSGTALKLRAAHSLLEAAGKGRFFDNGVGWLLQAAKIIDSRPTTQGGFGRRYINPDMAPMIERDTGLPRDDMEAAQELAALVGADAISIEERVVFLHPDWTPDQVAQEVAQIRAEMPTAVPGLPGLPAPAGDPQSVTS